MIQVTKLNKQSIYVNIDLIKQIEEIPDTKITFINGDMILVLEPVAEIIERVKKYKNSILNLGRLTHD